MNKKQKKMLFRILGAAVLLIIFSMLPLQGYLRAALFLIPYFLIGYDILLKAWKGICNKQVFDENFLMAVATVGAICLGDFKEEMCIRDSIRNPWRQKEEKRLFLVSWKRSH